MHSKDYFHPGMYTHQPRLMSGGGVFGNGGDEVNGPKADPVDKETGEVLWFPTWTCCGVIEDFVTVYTVEAGATSISGCHTYELGYDIPYVDARQVGGG